MRFEEIKSRLNLQKTFFSTGATLPLSHRKQALRKLLAALEANSEELFSALWQDLGKCRSESYLCEIGMVKSEIRYLLRHLNRYAGKHRVPTPVAQFFSRSYQLAVPYGAALIMSPWNYPILLSLEPLADAIAAGNTVILKPSAYAPASAAALEHLLSGLFPPEYVSVITGGREENASLLDCAFDTIFFTGSKAVGKEVMRRAADHLTPVTLELGGKSPCIVDASADLPLAARRIVFGKFMNCGQTCVAPDYILCERSVKDTLMKELKKQIKEQFSDQPLAQPDYGKIINQKHFERILALIEPDKVAIGGEICAETLRIAPTVLDHVTWEDAVMQEEIFGPVLPVLTYDRPEELPSLINTRDTPLALYLFSSDQRMIRFITARIPYGGGCINDTLIHLATCEMGFGGMGASGMGSYHGKAGFDAFSHYKSIVDKKTWLDLGIRYRPYTKKKDTLIRLFER